MFRAGLFNFSKGELAPALYGRIDVAAYSAALRKAENVVVLKYGGVTRRMGTRLVYEISPPAGGWSSPEAGQRLIPFEYSIEQTYMLLFTQAQMRPAALGGMVLERGLTVEAATNTDPVQITAQNHGYVTGQEVFFSGVQGMTELNGRTLVVTVLDGDRFTVPVDGRTWGAFTGDTGGSINPDPPPAPPPPPPVPPPLPDPDPPIVTPPGGGGFCVADHMMILMADGSERPARDLVAGDLVEALHDRTWRRGPYPVEAISFVEADVVAYDFPSGRLVATPGHRVWVRGDWRRMDDLGAKPVGRATVAKITVESAHTYIASGVISHNIKQFEEAQ